MLAFKDLADIHKITLQWESKLKDFYDVAEFALKSQESKRLLAVPRDRPVQTLEVLRKKYPDLPVFVLTAINREYAFDSTSPTFRPTSSSPGRSRSTGW